MSSPDRRPRGRRSQRVQTGVRIDRDLLKVLKGMAELYEVSLGELLEGMLLHALEGRSPFGPAALERITTLCEVYGLELGADDFDMLRAKIGAPLPPAEAPVAPRPNGGEARTTTKPSGANGHAVGAS